RRRHRSASVACRDETICAPFSDELRSDSQRTTLLAPHGCRHRLVHADDFFRLDKLNPAITLHTPAATLQLRHNLFRLPDENHADAQVARGRERSVNLRVRRAVTTHRVHNDLAGQLMLPMPHKSSDE